MTNTGGISTLKGVRYEIQAVIYEMPDLLEDRLVDIRYQPASSSLSVDQPPTGIFVDDYATQDEKGQKSFYQAKQNTKDSSWTVNRLLSEGVLRQFCDQHNVEPQSKLFFVSNIPAPQLQTLADHARQTISPDEFQRTLKQGMQKEAIRILNTLEITWENLWPLFKTVNHRLLTQDQIEKRILDYASERYADLNKFILVLKELIEKSPGSLVSRDTAIACLENKGLFRLPVSLSQDILTVLHQASGSLRNYRSDILGIPIDREETRNLEKWIDTTQEKHPVAFLLDVAGAGKSVILHDLLEQLEERAIPVLATKADIDLSHNVTDSASLRYALNNLPDSPESLLAAAVAKYEKAVLIIDQLDALSLTFSRNQACMDTVIGLIGRASSIQGVRVIVSCRSFDRKFDPKLRQIRSSDEFTIKPLTEAQIEQILSRLGLKWLDLIPREQEVLTNPLHLDLFATVIEEGNKCGMLRGSVATVQDLYGVLWELKILRPNSSSISPEELQDAIYQLVDEVHKSQELYQPVSWFDETSEVRNYLDSQGIFRRDGNKLSFFHQSFFDYCYARRFVSENESLAETVRRGDQGFFVRPQIVQTLSYLREVDPPRYLRELESLMDRGRTHEWLRQLKIHPSRFRRSLFAVMVSALSPPIRYHLRRLIFEWFGQQKNLTDQEKALGLSCMEFPKDRRLFLLGAQGNAEWFDVIQPQLANLLALSRKALDDEIVPFLRSVQEARPEEIFALLAKQLHLSEEWNNRISWCLNTYKGWQSSEAESCLLWLCENTQSPWQSLDLALHHIANANPVFGCRALRIILEQLKNQWRQKRRPPNAAECLGSKTINTAPNDEEAIKAYMDRMNTFRDHAEKLLPRQMFWMEDLINQAAVVCPSALLETILPWLEQVLPDLTWSPDENAWLTDKIFSSRFVHPFGGSASVVIQGFYKALCRLAEEDQEQFLSFAARIEQSRYLVLHEILAGVLAKHASQFASWACQYLLKDTLRLRISGIGSSIQFSRKLIGAVFPHCSSDERTKLEEAIVSYYPAWENIRWRGSSQLELLWEVPDELLTPTGRSARKLLRGKLEGYKPPEREHVGGGVVGSPIPEEETKILSDDAWLDAMRHYDDERRWDKPREGFLKGGVIELSRAFEKVVESEPERFAELAVRFDEGISSKYFRALAEGLAKSTVSSTTVFAVCETFSKKRPDDTTIQNAICDAIEKRVKDNVPKELIDLVRDIALTSADPDHKAWHTKAENDEHYYDGDPHFHGINSTRGRAVRVYVCCMMEASPLDTESLLSTLEKVATDTSSAVRSCLIEDLPYLLRFDSDRVISIFELAVKNRPELLECRLSDNFIYYALGRHGSRMLKHIEALMVSKEEEVRETCGRLASLAYFNVPRAKSLYRKCLRGDASLRRGVARVMARNVDQPQFLKQCLAALQQLCSDSDQSIRRNLGETFRYLPSPKVVIKKFIVRFLHSKSIVDAADDIVEYASRIQFVDPKLALNIAEQTQLALGKNIADIQRSAALVDDDLVSLAISIHTHSPSPRLKARAMDLFERVMDLGSHYAIEALKAADR